MIIEETGIVTKTEGGMAKVAVEKKGGCEGCAVKNACEAAGENMEIEALNPLHAREGQRVRVAMGTQTYLKGSMLVYGLPLALFVTAAIIGKNIGEAYFSRMSPDTIAAIAGFTALILSMLGVRTWIKRVETRPGYRPVIREILG
ncbi:MAG: SoxR reducing system RseC family protein [Deferribacteres bacterium]|nr:SoxR reducing system RseC family protein [Deferribacteres bacterium]